MKTLTKLPEGTTQEQWNEYNERLAEHEQFIYNYTFFLNRIVRQLEFVQPNKTWTTEEITKAITSEIKRSDSMDAPNKPGYYRANND